MAEKKITRKVISSHPLVGIKVPVKEVQVPEKEEVEALSKSSASAAPKKKVCFFCQSKTVPNYTDIVSLKKFTTERGKIVPKLKSSLCSKHQRRLTKEIKYARHLALLPFTPRV